MIGGNSIMKALVLKEYNRFEYEDVPFPQLGLDDVLVKVEAAGICGSDVHGMDGSSGRRKPPIIMGHEAAGVIAEVGENVKLWSSGDRVTFDSTVYCGRCWFCRRGEINLCENRMVLGVSCDEYRRHGAFAEYVSVPQRILYRMPDGLSFEQAAMVEPLSIAVHAAELTSPVRGQTAVVVGAGMIGLLVVQVLRAAGCGRIIAVDIEQGKLDLAKRFGADVVLKADASDVPTEVIELTAGRGADRAFEVVGAATTVQTALKTLRKGGTLTLIGNVASTVEIPLQVVVTRQISLIGSCASAGEYPACMDMMAGGQVDVKPLISKVAPLSEGGKWFRRLCDKEPGLMKVILRP